MTKEYLEQIIQLVTAAFGLVAALAWNSAIQGTINLFYPQGGGLLSQFVYAIIITLLAVWVTTSLSGLHRRLKK